VPSANFSSLQPQASFDVPTDSKFAFRKREIAFGAFLADELEMRHGILLPHYGSGFKASAIRPWLGKTTHLGSALEMNSGLVHAAEVKTKSSSIHAPGKLGLSICVLLAALVAPRLKAAEFYVAPAGDDSNAGSKDSPFASLERARDAVRDLRSREAQPKEGITIWIEGGDYLRTNSLELVTADSGSPEAPVSWRAVPGQTVRLIGGRQLDGFRPVVDTNVLGRLHESARSHVLAIDLGKAGITNLGEMNSRGFGRPTVPSHCELFYGGKPMTLARWPNEGKWEEIAGFPEDKSQPDDHGGKVGKLEDGFFYNGDRPKDWRETADIWVHGYWSWDWANSYERVVSLDKEKNWVKTAAPFGLYGFRKGQRYYFLNVLEELDESGEWYLDRSTNILYFWPPDERLKGAKAPEVCLSLSAESLLRFKQVSHVRMERLILEATRGSAVEIKGGTNNLIVGCTILNIGNWGVRIEGGSRHGVRSCDISDTGDGGVSLGGGNRQDLTPGGHFVENCHFQRQGRWSKCYVPAILIGGVGHRASHNFIHDHPHCAILFSGNDHLLEYNEIHHIALETGDVGAIYAGRDYTFRGNRIRYNYIHHTGGVGMGSMGVYMDDCVSGTEIFGNIFYKVQRAAFLGGGRDHQVVNNIFVECNHAVELDGRGLDKSPVWHNMVDKTMRESLTQAPLQLYREHYPAMKNLDTYYGTPGGTAITGAEFKGVPPEGNVVLKNICVGKWLNVSWNASVSMLKLESNLTNAAPGFVAQPNDSSPATDFRLDRDSAAFKLGFEQVPAEKMGLYRDQFRTTLP